MESKTSSGQILIECALGLFIMALLFSFILDFDGHKNIKDRLFYKTGQEKLKQKQLTDLRGFKNGR